MPIKHLQPSPPYESYFLLPHYFEANPVFYEGLLWKEKETIFLEETEDCSDLKVFTKQ